MIGFLISSLFTVVLVVFLLKLIYRLPTLADRPQHIHKYDVSETQLARKATPLADKHPGLTGVHILADARNAFAGRVALIRAAERSLDLQYYMWHDDVSGRMLYSETIQAADRGVLVRILIDDNTTVGLDPLLASMAGHKNIELRLFNPLVIRRLRFVNYFFDFFRLNRRMHNKSITADCTVTIVGGRNLGDEYFGAETGGFFIDMDCLAIGAVVQHTMDAYNRYWNSQSTYPAEKILNKVAALDVEEVRDDLASKKDTRKRDEYLKAVLNAGFETGVINDSIVFEWCMVTLFCDDPAKGLGKAKSGALLIDRIKPEFRAAQHKIELVSAYFIPSKNGTELLTGLAKGGRDISIVTNGFSVNDVKLVHAGYSKWRRPLLQSGIHLYELRKLTCDAVSQKKPGGWTRFSGNGESLHAKTFIIDSKVLYIGSFNFDPRSAKLNCEMVFRIDNPTVAETVHNGIRYGLPEHAWHVKLNRAGNMVWLETQNNVAIELSTEPEITVFEKFLVRLLGLLPIDWLL